MTTLHCDVAVIGAGTAGIAAERSARRHGAKTLLIDDRFAGTTCATVGCMPSKLLIAAANAAHAVRQAPLFGINAPNPVVDGVSVMQRVRQERDRFATSAKASLNELPDGIRVQARARFLNATTLLLDDGRHVISRAIVIATGSAASIPKEFEAVRDYILTNETIFEMAALPRSVAVIGAGPLGLELAQALARLGIETSVFDESTHLTGIADKTVAQDFLSILRKELPISLGVKLKATLEGGGVMLAWSGPSEGSRQFDRLLLAAGRPPVLAGLNLEATPLVLDKRGSPAYDPTTLQCGGSSIFIAGDADHDRPVLHEASAEGTIAGRNAAAYPAVTPSKRFVPLFIMFTDPPVAIVGTVPPPEALDIVVGCVSYEDQGRAKVFARNSGLVHLYANANGGRLLGATIVGPGVEHSAHLIAWAIQMRMTATDVLDLPFYHPTYEEGLKPALRSICDSVKTPSSTGDSPAPGA
jgi:dihydrolipoamide dehydrogenase